jgi:NADH dehydrogenase [ubiquinone] 1 alpha subcomplex assembly factor 5
VLFSIHHRAQSRTRSEKNFIAHNFLFTWAEQQILERLSLIKRSFTDIALIGRGNEALLSFFAAQNITRITIDNQIDEVKLPPTSQDLIISVLDLHNLNDLPGVLIQICRSLKPDGVFIACMGGGETLYELRDVLYQTETELYGGVSPRVHPFADKPEMGGLLQRAGFQLPVVDSEILRVSYRDIFHLMSDIRGMGERNIIRERRKNFTPKSFFNRANEAYKALYPDTQDASRIIASFEIIFMIGWAAHETQQKPLRPGSATARLADILNTTETKI